MILKNSRNRMSIGIQGGGLNLRHANRPSDNVVSGRPNRGDEFLLHQAGSQTDDWALLHRGIVQ